MIDLIALKNIAKNKLKKEIKTEADLIDFLGIWFSNKYNLPSNHPLFLNKTLEELMIDFYIDRINNDSEETSLEAKEEYEEWLKKQMGDNYKAEDDFLISPNTPENKKKEIEKEINGEFEDTFEVK